MILISFSGGETSAYMTWWMLQNQIADYDIAIVFANTGEENEETLTFVDQCDRLLFAPFGRRVVWIEAVQFHGERKSPGFRIVDFATASRNGEPFEDAITKYGIPGPKAKDCTRNLKQRPIEAYAKSIGWEPGSYWTAIGIRADEIDRLSPEAKKRQLLYPLASSRIHPRTKPQINQWWSQQPFRLRLKGYQGNCKWCWKKSFRKHLTIIGENPSAYDFPRRMEAQYGLVGAEFQKPSADLPPDYRRTFFRENKSTDDLFAMYEARKGTLRPAEDDSLAHPEPDLFDELDTPGGCGESCEVWSDEQGQAA